MSNYPVRMLRMTMRWRLPNGVLSATALSIDCQLKKNGSSPRVMAIKRISIHGEIRGKLTALSRKSPALFTHRKLAVTRAARIAGEFRT